MSIVVLFIAGLIALVLVVKFLRFVFSGSSGSAPVESSKRAERRRIDVNPSGNNAAARAAQAAEDRRRRRADEWARSPINPANINSPLHPANPRNMNNPANPLSPLNPSNRNRNR